MTETSLLATVAAAAAAAPTDPAPTAPAATAAAPVATPPAATAPAAPAASSTAAPVAATPAFSPRMALELTALAYPSMSATLTKLAATADNGETAFRAALLAERAEAPPETISTTSTSTRIDPPKGRPAEAAQRGSSLKAAAAKLNG